MANMGAGSRKRAGAGSRSGARKSPVRAAAAGAAARDRGETSGAALRECRERLHDLTELSSDWWWEQDAQFRFVDVSKSNRSHGGISRADHFGKTRWELPNTVPVGTTWQAHKAVLRARKPFRDLLLRRIDKEDGSDHYIVVNGKPLFGRDGSFRGYRGIATDVTGKVVAERALRESEEHFRSTFEQAAVGIVHTTTDGRITRVNRKFCEMLGHAADELLGASTRDLTHPDDRDRQDVQRRGLLTGERTSFHGEKRYLRKDGSTVWVNRTVTLARQPSGRGRYLIQVFEDITGRVGEETRRREIESRFRATFEQAAVGIVHADLENHYIQVNRKFCEIVGYVPDELVGKSATMVSYPDDQGEATDSRRLLLAGKIDSFKQEKRYRCKDGSTIWVTLTESLARGEDGTPLYFIRVIEDITGRKVLESQFQTLFEQAAVGIVRSDFERNILEVNRRFCEMIGYDRDELLRMDMKQISHPEDLAIDTVDRGRLLNGEIRHFAREKRYVCRDGSVIWAKRTVSLARDTLGNPEHFIFVIEDVTDRKEAEEIYRATFESAPVGIMHTAPDRRILHVNSKLCEVLGYSREELLRMKLDDIVRADALGSDQPRFMQAMVEGRLQSYVSERPYVRRDGSTVWVNRTVSLVRDADGEPRYFIRIVQDISERKAAEETVARERALLRAVVDVLPERIYVKDREGRFLLQNATNLRVRGIADHDEIVGKTVFDIFPRDLAEKLDAEDRGVMESGMPLLDREGKTFFGDTGRQGGSVRWHLTSKLPLKDSEGRVFGLVGVNRDITDRKEAERALRENEDLYRNLFERAPLPLLVIDEKSLRLLEVNRAAIEKYGYSHDEFLAMSILDLQVEEDRVRVEQELRSRDPSRSAFFRRRHVTKRGEQLFMEVTGRPFVFQGLQSRMLLVNDVTERHRAETALQESEELFRQLAGNIPQVFWIADVSQHHTIYVSPASEAMIGRPIHEMLSDRRLLVRSVHKKDRARLAAARRKAARGGYDETFRIVRPDGSVRWVHDRAFPVRDAGGIIYRIAGIAEDITERRQAEHALRESEEQFRQLAGNIPQVFWITDVTQRELIYVSPAYERVTARPIEQLKMNPRAWLEAVHPEDRDRVRQARRDALRGTYDEIFRLVRPDGEVRWIRDRAFPVRDAEGNVYRIAGIGEDITDRRDAEERLMYLAHYDALTSLPNRVLFYDRLKQALAQARRNDWITAVMFLDLDRFKNVNDTLGHSAGDELLKQVSGRVTACVRSGDTVGRLGGDEFAIVLSNLTGPSDASLVAQKIMSALGEPFQLDGSEVFVTASTGITLFPTDSEDQDTLIRNADTAMYRAKELGRNGFQFYTSEMNSRALEKLSLESNLRRALERREFLLYYQPKASLATGEITGLEALLRWRHPDLGLVSPADFMPMLEETGLIVATGEWVIRSACAQIRAWRQAGARPVPVAVNLSARQFQAKDLGQSIARILDEEEIAHGLLELEITESSLVGNTEEAANTLGFLNSLGIRVAIDDFGTGYSSLSYLKRFPLDSLKIDGSFVRDITTDSDDAAITRAIITMAHSLDLEVVAEGVETEQQLNFLNANGCDEIQGYYFSAPMPAEDVLELLMSGRRLRRPRPADPGDQAAVLLVDDDQDALMLLERELSQDGYTIYTATSALEGLDILGRQDIRVVVSDYSMPGMSGVEFLQKVKSLYPDTVRIMLSGHTDFHTVTEAVNKGEIYRFVAKTWSSSHLRANIRQGLLAMPRHHATARLGSGRSPRTG